MVLSTPQVPDPHLNDRKNPCSVICGLFSDVNYNVPQYFTGKGRLVRTRQIELAWTQQCFRVCPYKVYII